MFMRLGGCAALALVLVGAGQVRADLVYRAQWGSQGSGNGQFDDPFGVGFE